jgi:3-isopropylmalate dehydratase small subunit
MSNDSVIGFAPVVKVSAERPPEKEIYKKMWSFDQFRITAPGESCAADFLKQAKPKPGASVIDFGCGTGRGGLMLAVMGQMNVTLLDFADNCLDKDIIPMLETQKHTMRFVEADLNEELTVSAEYGFCTDVMEHVRPHRVDSVLNHILRAAQHVYFQIATADDNLGEPLIGHPLHLTVQPYDWWLQKFKERDCVIHYSKSHSNYCTFYVSAWLKGSDIVEVGELNMEQDEIRENVKFNLAQGWSQVTPHETNEVELMIVGGGPSVIGQVDEIRRLRAEGVKLITINGAYKWCIEQGLTPSALVMVDARPFNAKFSKPVIDDCKYFIASQCDPAVFDGLPKDRTLIWHTTAEMVRDLLQEQYKDEPWYGIPGGSTVLLRAIPMFRMLGFKRFHLFGCDSCLSDNDAHHAYEQKENDGQPAIRVNVGGKFYFAHLWMISQAQEFIDLIKFMGNEIELEIHGEGLLAGILEAGAAMVSIPRDVTLSVTDSGDVSFRIHFNEDGEVVGLERLGENAIPVQPLSTWAPYIIEQVEKLTKKVDKQETSINTKSVVGS